MIEEKTNIEISISLENWSSNMKEKINQIRELVREIKSYDDVLYMSEGDKIDLEIKKQELWDLLQKL